MKNKFTMAFVAFSCIVSAQLTSTITDVKTGKPIPYVNVYRDDKHWVSADENGVFMIDASPQDVLSFTAVGYEPAKINVGNEVSIGLVPATYVLENVTITKPKRTIEKSIGGYSRKALDNYYTTGGTPELMARYFPPDATAEATPFFKKLVINTKSPIRNAKFNIHFLEVNEDGTPGREMAYENIIGIAKKGVNDTEIDLTNFGLRMPENGFFIAVEWLIIPENRYTGDSYTGKDGVYHEHIQYAPYFGTIRNEENVSWGYRTGASWKPFQKVSPERIQKYYDDFKKATGKDAPPFDNRHVEFAMKLTMTN
jgi:hypothetical protein